MEKQRSSFTGKIGFVLAAAGSAVGLGNLWRFPYLAAQYGGGIFLFIYIILAVTFGFALMIAEIALGRKTGLSVVGAYKKLNKKFAFLGYLAALVPMIILPYYSVIGGWVVKYLFTFVSDQAGLAVSDSFFSSFIAQPIEPIGWFLLFIGVTALVVLMGVEKGVENVSKFMMPILAILAVFIAGYSLFLPGAMEGVKYYLLPDFSKFSVTTVLAALGQLFYSMSLAMGIMITYGSYMKKEVNLESSVRQIEFFDTGIAFIAGLMIIPAVFSFSNGDASTLGQGPGLMFVTLPKVFDAMPGGTFIGIAFFVLVLFAALTSSISLMETVVSIVQDKFKISRNLTCIVVLIGCIIIGLPSCLGYSIWDTVTVMGMQFLDFFDFISNSVMMPIIALLTCIFVGYFIKPKTIIDEVEISGNFKQKKMFSVMIKYIAPICIILILLTSFLSLAGIFKI